MATGDQHRATAGDGVVAVERTVDLQDQGVIVRLTVSTDRDGEVPFEVVDELPTGLDPGQVAFHPDHAPEDGEASAEGVTVEGAVSADEELVVVYGAQVDASEVSEMALTDPRLTVNSQLSEADGGVRGLIRRALGRGNESSAGGASATESDSVESFDTFPGDERPTETPLAQAEAELDAESISEAESETESESDPETPTSELEPAVTAVESEAESAPESEAEPDPETESDSDPETESDSDPEPESVVTAAEPDKTADDTSEPMVSDTPDADPSDESSEQSTTSETAAAAAGSGSVAAMLAEEIQNGEVADEDLDVLRDELSAELTESQSVRLDHVQARMDEFAAYADTLGEFLDEEGRPAEVIGDLREELQTLESDITDLQSAIGDLEVEMSTAADEREALREDIDVAASEVATVEEELGGEIESVGTELADEVERVERQARAAREGVKSDLAEMEAAIERVDKLRAALEEAFAPMQNLDTSMESDANTAANGAGSESETEETEPETETEAEADDYGADGGIDLTSVEGEDDPADGDASFDI